MIKFLKIAIGLQFLMKMMKFKIVPRVWLILLILVNISSIYFIDTPEGQVVLGIFVVSVAVMIAMDAMMGLVRLLGLGHVLWLGLLPWLFFRLAETSPDTLLYRWILLLIAMNGISLIIDVWDVIRYFKGERELIVA